MKERGGTENSDFSCILRGEVTYLEEIKDYITQEYVTKGLVTLVNPSYTKETHILTDDQWKEYQKLKKCREENLIGAGFP